MESVQRRREERQAQRDLSRQTTLIQARWRQVVVFRRERSRILQELKANVAGVEKLLRRLDSTGQRANFLLPGKTVLILMQKLLFGVHGPREPAALAPLAAETSLVAVSALRGLRRGTGHASLWAQPDIVATLDRFCTLLLHPGAASAVHTAPSMVAAILATALHLGPAHASPAVLEGDDEAATAARAAIDAMRRRWLRGGALTAHLSAALCHSSARGDLAKPGAVLAAQIAWGAGPAAACSDADRHAVAAALLVVPGLVTRLPAETLAGMAHPAVVSRAAASAHWIAGEGGVPASAARASAAAQSAPDSTPARAQESLALAAVLGNYSELLARALRTVVDADWTAADAARAAVFGKQVQDAAAGEDTGWTTADACWRLTPALEGVVALQRRLPSTLHLPSPFMWVGSGANSLLSLSPSEEVAASIRALFAARGRAVRDLVAVFAVCTPSALPRPPRVEAPPPSDTAAAVIMSEHDGSGDAAQLRARRRSAVGTVMDALWRTANWASRLVITPASRGSSGARARAGAAAPQPVVTEPGSAAYDEGSAGEAASPLGAGLPRAAPAQWSHAAFHAPAVEALCCVLAVGLAGPPAVDPRAAPAPPAAEGATDPAIGVKYALSFGTLAVRRLWEYLMHVGKVVAHAAQSDPHRCRCEGVPAVLFVFAHALRGRLSITDYEELYEEQRPLALSQMADVVSCLRVVAVRGLSGMSFDEADAAARVGGGALPTVFGKALVRLVADLLNALFEWHSRRPLCAAERWLEPSFDEAELNQWPGDALLSHPLLAVPITIPFPARVRAFRRALDAERERWQQEGSQNLLRFTVHRSSVVEDTYRLLQRVGPGELRKKLYVTFINESGLEEAGIDARGLFKELWRIVSDALFTPVHGLFAATPSHQLYPNPAAALAVGAEQEVPYLRFLGRVLGKALFEGVVVHLEFAPFFLSKLQGKRAALPDLRSLDADLFRNLMWLKRFNGDVAELDLDFTVTVDNLGKQEEVQLLPNGAGRQVRSSNRMQYVFLASDYYLNRRGAKQAEAFLSGVADVIDPQLLRMFSPPELQVVICGSAGGIDVDDLRRHARYTGGYFSAHRCVRMFWRVVEKMSMAERGMLLEFVTACPRPPPLGFSELTPAFCVQRVPVESDTERLPTASACFNTLKLPTFGSEKAMREKLLMVIQSGAGFELS